MVKWWHNQESQSTTSQLHDPWANPLSIPLSSKWELQLAAYGPGSGPGSDLANSHVGASAATDFSLHLPGS